VHVIRALIGMLAALAAGGVLAADPAGRTPTPVVERATAGTQCVAPPEVMRRSHMDFLKHQRDDTVHGGIRGAKFSLKGCIECHASQQTGSVNQAETNFCVSCHSYVAVKIDCFGCHTGKPSTAVAQGAPK
jgi:predicted CXXCH cytochrome family protein